MDGTREFAPARLMMRAAGVTDRGRTRPTNEDCYGIDRDLRLCVVADGMGGHRAGEVASRMAVDVIIDYVGRAAVSTTWPFGFEPSASEAGNLLRTAVHAANARIFAAASARSEYFGMGTTVVAILEREGVVSIAHVGDSRVYLASGGRLRQMTVDDSWAATMLARDPQADLAAFESHPMRNALTNVVGSRPRTLVHISECPAAAGDVFALTTDGVHGVLGEGALSGLLARGGEAKSLATELVQAALDHGSRDNCTAVVVELT